MFSTRQNKSFSKASEERGVALLACIFALLLLTGVALAMVFMSDTDQTINNNYRDSQRAYFAAQAGISEAISRMMMPPSGVGAIPPPDAMPTTLNGKMYYITNAKGSETVQPWDANNGFWDVELCKEGLYSSVTNNNDVGAPCPKVSTSFPSGSAWYTSFGSVSPGTSTSAALDYKWVRISLKGNGSGYPHYVNGSNASATLATQVCTDGSKQSLLAAASCSATSLTPVWVVTSMAQTDRGTRRVVQAEFTKVQMPPVPGALTFLGPGSQLTPPYDAPNSNPFHIDGNDHGGCGTNHPAIVTTDSTTQGQVIGAIPNNRLDHYTGVGGSIPDVEVVLPSNMPTSWQTPAEAEAVAALMKSAASPANVHIQGPSDPAFQDINIGSQSNPQITYVDGDLTMTGATRGGGILVVTGTLTMSGNSGFYGVILVIGRGVFMANGGGNGQYDGAVLIAHTRDNNGNLLSTMGNPIVDWGGGGGNGIYYNQCAINMVQGSLGYTTVASRELPY